jgi:hypothetical protein
VDTETVVSTAAVPGFSRKTFAFGVGPDGTAYVAQLGHTSTPTWQYLVLIATRSPGGVWSEEIVPTGAVDFACFSLVPGNAGEVAIAYCAGDYGRGDEVWVVRREGGTWSDPELVLLPQWDGLDLLLSFGGSPDLEKLVLSATSGGRTKLFVRGTTGWDGVEVGPTRLPGWVGVGTDGGAWALYSAAFPAERSPQLYNLFLEAP